MEPTEAVNVRARPLRKLLARPIEPAIDLKTAVRSVKLVAEPKEELRVRKRPLVPELARLMELVRDRNSKVCSEKAEEELVEPVNDLKREVFSVKPEAVPKFPEKDLMNEYL